jgi:hypothetical protein
MNDAPIDHADDRLRLFQRIQYQGRKDVTAYPDASPSLRFAPWLGAICRDAAVSGVPAC